MGIWSQWSTHTWLIHITSVANVKSTNLGANVKEKQNIFLSMCIDDITPVCLKFILVLKVQTSTAYISKTKLRKLTKISPECLDCITLWYIKNNFGLDYPLLITGIFWLTSWLEYCWLSTDRSIAFWTKVTWFMCGSLLENEDGGGVGADFPMRPQRPRPKRVPFGLGIPGGHKPRLLTMHNDSYQPSEARQKDAYPKCPPLPALIGHSSDHALTYPCRRFTWFCSCPMIEYKGNWWKKPGVIC